MTCLISVVIPCYNCQNTIEETILSILKSTLDKDIYEVIAVNDCSKDNTAIILDRYADKIRVIHKEANDGPSKTRNTGIAAAKGEFVAFCDSDDLWEQDKLRKQLERFSDPQVGIVCTDVDIFSGKRQVLPRMSALRPLQNGNVFFTLLETNFIVTSSVMARKSVLQNAGGFDEGLWFSEDIDLWLKIAREWKIVSIDEVLVHYRESEHSLSKNVTKMNESKIKVLDRATEGLIRTTRNRILSNCYQRQGRNLFYEREFHLARNRFRNSIMVHPCAMTPYIYLLLTFLPGRLIDDLANVVNHLRHSLPHKG